MTKTKDKHLFVVEVDVWQSQVLIAVNTPINKIIKYIRKNTSIKPTKRKRRALRMDSRTRGRCCNVGGLIVIRLKSLRYVEDYGFLAHEAYHATEFILTRAGMITPEPYCEATAYTIQHIFEQATEGVK